MATYVELKFNFQNLSEIEIFRNSKDFRMILISIIIMRSWCYIWCCKQHSIIVAGFQQKCCFSAQNVDFSWLFISIHVKIGNQTKKQHLLPENNNFVENQQQWYFVAPPIIYSIRIIQKPIRYFPQFFDSCFGRIPWEFIKEMHLLLFFSKFPRNPSKTWVKKSSKASDRLLDDPGAINDGWSNRTSLLLIFNKIVVFRQQMLFFRLISNFFMN